MVWGFRSYSRGTNRLKTSRTTHTLNPCSYLRSGRPGPPLPPWRLLSYAICCVRPGSICRCAARARAPRLQRSTPPPHSHRAAAAPAPDRFSRAHVSRGVAPPAARRRSQLQRARHRAAACAGARCGYRMLRAWPLLCTAGAAGLLWAGCAARAAPRFGYALFSVNCYYITSARECL